MACEPGKLAYRNIMIPELRKIIEKLKKNEGLSNMVKKLRRNMTRKFDQVPWESDNCTKKICLKNIYLEMQNAG